MLLKQIIEKNVTCELPNRSLNMEGKMYFYLINDKRPIRTKYPIRNKQQAQAKVKNMIVNNVKYISMLSYVYYLIKYEIHG